MEEKELNLCEILKGHEREEFYSPTFGRCRFNSASDTLYFESLCAVESFELYLDGSYSTGGNCIIFPSEALYLKYPLDAKKAWDEWIEAYKTKTPKTWSELENTDGKNYYLKYIHRKLDYNCSICEYSPIEKSALALLKIHQLIEVGYGGNIGSDERYLDTRTIDPTGFCPVRNDFEVRHIAFHTEEQAKEFLKHPENVQLLKDYFMI